ncbi:MAG TPA: hypothetical protein VHV83_14050 [Armatimonadota bacterium]|nr:hypothetical protein [Armatimonadota bacterium]
MGVIRTLRHECGELIEEHESPDIGGKTIIDYSPYGHGKRHLDIGEQCPFCGKPLTPESLEPAEIHG